MAGNLLRQMMRIEEDATYFYITDVYEGGHRTFNNHVSYSSVFFRVKLQIHKSGYASGISPKVTLEMMVLPSPGTWNLLDEFRGKMKADLSQVIAFERETLMVEAAEYALRTMDQASREHIQKEFAVNGLHEPTDTDFNKILRNEVKERIFPKMRKEKFDMLLDDDMEEILKVAEKLFYR
jgi:hypothetical protein